MTLSTGLPNVWSVFVVSCRPEGAASAFARAFLIAFMLMLVSVFDVVPALSLPPAMAPPPDKKLAGYELDQITSVNGKFRVSACASAVRVDQLTYGYSFISCAPDWDVMLFRPDTKEYAQLTYKEWLKTNLVVVTTLWTMELKKPDGVRHFENNGLGYISYSFPSTSTSSGFRGTAGRAESKALENNSGEIVCLDFPADVHAGGVIGRALALPELRGIAVQATRRSAAASAWTLKTLKTRRNETISSNLFVLPKGLKKVAFNRNLLMSGNDKDAINYMFADPNK